MMQSPSTLLMPGVHMQLLCASCNGEMHQQKGVQTRRAACLRLTTCIRRYTLAKPFTAHTWSSMRCRIAAISCCW